MAGIDAPFPPGHYPVVVVGSGPGGLQTSYFLRRLGVDHAVISEDDKPGGMFRRYPIFGRLISWTKPFAPAARTTSAYGRFDWNSLLAEDAGSSAIMPEVMDGSSYFPSRAEMEKGLVMYSQRAGIQVRYGCRWSATRRTDDGFLLETTGGDYSCKVIVFAIGMAQPWKPEVEGLDAIPHYVETRPPKDYADASVFIIGKRNSAFEIADGLLPWARRVILASPSPARVSVVTRSLVGARARYLQPYEDYVLGGGNVILDATIERVEKNEAGYRVHTRGSAAVGQRAFDVDHVIAATGFQVPLVDLESLGVATVMQGRLPAQTPFWESTSVPGIYFAGTVSQGAIELKKHGIPSNSAAVHGFRSNSEVLARHIARSSLGIALEQPRVDRGELVDVLLGQATEAAALWNQRSYLARVFELGKGRDIVDQGLLPLVHFVDSDGTDAVALTIETDGSGDVYPVLYLRRAGSVEEHRLPSEQLAEYRTEAHRRALWQVLEAWLR